MAKLLQLRRGTTTQHASFTGAEGEVTVDTNKDTVVVHDGSTAGGKPLATETANALKAPIAGPTFTGIVAIPNVANVETAIVANTAKTGITSGQASAITANTSKVTNATHTGDVTGGTALTIATDAVDIAMLSATGTADDTTYLRGDNAWAEVAGGTSWQSVVTASTLTAVAGNGYSIDTTSNACTITLPASASVGDAIEFVDYARNWVINSIVINPNSLNYEGSTTNRTYPSTKSLRSLYSALVLSIVYVDATKGWLPIINYDINALNLQGIFLYGYSGSYPDVSNIVSSAGVVATDATTAGHPRQALAGVEYGGDKGLMAYGIGNTSSGANTNNKISNTGVVASDGVLVGTSRGYLAACGFGFDKGLFYGGYWGGGKNIANIVSNVGVLATDTTPAGVIGRGYLAGCEYGADKGIFGFGYASGVGDLNYINLVSNLGIIAVDGTSVGTARDYVGGCSYGGDKGIFGFGDASGYLSITNLVSNTGVVSADVTGVGTARRAFATQYGLDKGIFAYGRSDASSYENVSNLVSNTGVVATDVTGVGTGRYNVGTCSFN